MKIALAWRQGCFERPFVHCKVLKQQCWVIVLKDSCESHFQFLESNVNVKEKKIGQLKHAKYGVVVLKNRVSLSQINVIKCAYAWAKYKMHKHLGFHSLLCF